MKRTIKTISLRLPLWALPNGQSLSLSKGLPEYMLEELRTIANKRDVSYQSLIKIFLRERIDQELRSVS